jgi:hypothetical protein
LARCAGALARCAGALARRIKQTAFTENPANPVILSKNRFAVAKKLEKNKIFSFVA